MRTFILVSSFLLLTTTTAQATLHGSWSGNTQENGKIYLQLVRPGHQHGQTVPLSIFSGLTPSQVASSGTTPVQFELRREAGTIRFEGTFRSGFGGGPFFFEPNERYRETLRSLGVDPAMERRKRHEPNEDLLQLALHDVSTEFIRSMQAEGYRVSLGDYVKMRIFRVDAALVREFRALGFARIDADDLVSSQIHGVTPQYVRDMRAAGFTTADLDDLQSARIHKATPEFVAEMQALGYRGLDLDELVSFRIHRVTPEFVRELKALGYESIPADDLVSMRIHRVTPEFIRELQSAGYRNIPVQKLVSMRIHGIEPEFVRRMNKGQ